ncbi:excinuclease ABC subunit UvrC [Aeromicrobium sp. 636]|uniref:UvrABC system protein C n=1 Tax=Aeromicrobium senzhongii TaxID=2663859 RepID=A0A8I0ETT5_9ACTN|nr:MULTISPECIES: excinuclease ABC subunit UvrC [Aeromicrobium]MBC9224915.1 excinuclease ABC subunit UvrC [Aeromicrobium senzhongii]MCQ3997027.1 excinuclease ABC subunit UvrC [Aeromicrobium sp. 636]MTB86961.1 excinuclease ABC subunit UvrC [Aeromicrobium senzhongii]QNL93212.1 excinuclease ABC subunit UvrC [Aeromicrobium senzhongii]
MADPSTYRPRPGEIPTSPGVYRFRDEQGRVIYVGKAKSLRPRLSSYFQDLGNLHPRTHQMVTTAASVDWTVVNTEVEALALEYSWIKEFDPRFNVKYRDDKSYPWLAVTVGEEIPRVLVMRGAQRKGVRYFGPYGHAWAIRDTVDTLLRVFPMRSCSAGVFKRAKAAGRPCLLGDIGKCSAPCVGRVSPEEHRKIVDDFLAFMGGQTAGFERGIEQRMRDAAAAQEYELAAKYRDDLMAMRRVLEKQSVVLGDGTDADVLGFVDDPLEVAVQIFNVRGGRIRGQRGWVADKGDDAGLPELVQSALMTLYSDVAPSAIPREVLVPELPADHDAVAELLTERRGGKVTLRVPRRGDKRALLETVEQNAKQSMARHKLKRSGDLTTRSRALEEIQVALELPAPPLRIECFDVSNLQGTEIVASMVVFEDGLPRKSEYRRFTVRHEGQSDVAAMHEVITRRFTHHLRAVERQGETEPGIDPETGKPRRFAYAPSLVVVDGGPPQVEAARQAMEALGVTGVALCGLAKRLEEVWLPGEEDPVILPRTSEGLYLLQRVRDEAHRFAITHHRQRRSKSMVESLLDPVPGLGETRRRALMRHFGSLKKLRAASVEEITVVPGIGPATAESIVAALHEGESPAPAVNMATGEILED